MCIHVALVDELPTAAVWDPEEVRILVARGSHVLDVFKELHALLTVDLGAPAPTANGLLCFCGADIILPTQLQTCTPTARAC